MKITFKELVFTLIFGALIVCLALWQGTRESEQKFEQQEQEVMDIDTAKMQEEKVPPNQAKLNLSYFPEEEIKVITAAAKRNNLRKGLYPVLYAIRKAENGEKRRELGIIHPRCEAEMDKRPNETLDIQAGWCAATVQKNYDRWIRAGKPNDYIIYLGDRFCFVGAANDPDGLNKNWIGNVNSWLKKIRE